MKIFIAGGSGFIGSRLVTHLEEQDYDVTVLDLFWFGDYLPKETKRLKQDLFSLRPEDLESYDAVVFLAGLSNDPMAEYSPALNFIHNAAGPAHLAYVAKTAGVKRFVYASSCSVYGWVGEDGESSETDSAKSMYPYGISKLQGELAVRELDDENFSVLSLRQGTVCGWSPRMRFDLVINAMYKNALTQGVVTVDNPKIWRPILAITDAVKAYEKAITADPNVRGTFNVSSGNYTVGEIGDQLVSHLKEKYGHAVELVVNNQPSYRNYRVSTQKAKDILGVNFTESIPSIIEDLHQHCSTHLADADDDKYYNVKTFIKLLDEKDSFAPHVV
jgi:nucleoside-diphosphate-sugar epimerase